MASVCWVIREHTDADLLDLLDYSVSVTLHRMDAVIHGHSRSVLVRELWICPCVIPARGLSKTDEITLVH